jgi:hypothetical protein
MDGEFSEESIRKIRDVRREFLEVLHRRKRHQRERKNETSKKHSVFLNEISETLLEFLEGCFCGMVNTLS